MRANNLKKTMRRASGLMMVLVTMLAIFVGIGLAGSAGTDNVASAAYTGASNTNATLLPFATVPMGNDASTATLNLLNGSPTTYRDFHQYTDGDFRSGGVGTKTPVYGTGEIFNRARNLSGGGTMAFYAYYKLPDAFTMSGISNFTAALNYTYSDLAKVSSVDASVITVSTIPTADPKMGSFPIANNQKQTQWGNGSYSFTVNNLSATAGNYLRVMFRAYASEEISNTATSGNQMMFGIKDVTLKLTVTNDFDSPTITPWNGTSAPINVYNGSSTTDLYQTYFREDNGRVYCDTTDVTTDIAANNEYTAGIYGVTSKKITFNVYDHLAGLQALTIGGYSLDLANFVGGEAITTSRNDWLDADLANNNIDLQGVASITLKPFGYSANGVYDGNFRGLQVTLVYDGKEYLSRTDYEADVYNEIISKTYSVGVTDHGGNVSNTSMRLGGIDGKAPEAAQVSVVTAPTATGASNWYAGNDIEYRVTYNTVDPMNNVVYTYKLERRNEVGGAVVDTKTGSVNAVIAGSTTKYNFNSLITASGYYTYTVHTEDKVGNVGGNSSVSFAVDLYNLTSVSAVQSVTNAGGLYDGSVASATPITVSLTTLGNFSSALNRYQYRVGNEPWQDTTSLSFVYNSNQSTQYSYRIITGAGVTVYNEATDTVTIMYDDRQPGSVYSVELEKYTEFNPYLGMAAINVDLLVDGDVSDAKSFYVQIDDRTAYEFTPAQAESGTALVNLYDESEPFAKVKTAKTVKLWYIDNKDVSSAVTELQVYVDAPKLFVDFVVSESDRFFDGTVNTAGVVTYDLYSDAAKTPIGDVAGQLLKYQVRDFSVGDKIVLSTYADDDVVYINNSYYVLKANVLNSINQIDGFDVTRTADGWTLTAEDAQTHVSFANFKLDLKTEFSEATAGEGRTISLVRANATDPYVKLTKEGTENFIIVNLADGDTTIAENGGVIATKDIKKAQLIMFWKKVANNLVLVTAQDRDYDGTDVATFVGAKDYTTFACTSNADLDNDGTPDWQTFTWTGDVKFVSKDVAYNTEGAVIAQTVEATNVVFTGTGYDEANYEIVGRDAEGNVLTNCYTSAKISPKELLLSFSSIFEPDNKTYDGNVSVTFDAVPVSIVLTGVVAGEEDSVVLPYTAAFDNKNVGAGKAVTVTFGTIARGNYVYAGVSTYSVTATILAKDVTITELLADSREYDGTTEATLDTYTLSGILEGEAVSIKDTLTGNFVDATDAPVAAIGSYKVLFAGVELDGADAGNYRLVNMVEESPVAITAATPVAATANAAILEKMLVAVITADGKTYDGTTTVKAGYTSAITTVVTGGAHIDVAFASYTSANASATAQATFYLGRFVAYTDAYASLTRYALTFDQEDATKITSVTQAADGGYVLVPYFYDDADADITASYRLESYVVTKTLPIAKKPATARITALYATDEDGNRVLMDKVNPEDPDEYLALTDLIYGGYFLNGTTVVKRGANLFEVEYKDEDGTILSAALFAPEFNNPVQANTNVSATPYTFEISSLVADNYDFTGGLTGLEVTVGKYTVTVSIEDFSRVYGNQYVLTVADLTFDKLVAGNNAATLFAGANAPVFELVIDGTSHAVPTALDLPAEIYDIRITLPILDNYAYAVPADAVYSGAVSGANYVIVKEDAFTVNQQTLDALVTFNNGNAVFNGSARTHTAIIDGAVDKTKADIVYTYYKVTYAGGARVETPVTKMVNAGEYKVELSATRKADAAIVDYPYAAYNKSVTFTITKQDTVITPNTTTGIEVTWTGEEVEYDDFTLSAAVGSLVGVDETDFIVEYSTSITFAEIIEAPSDAGVYYARARFEGSANYRASATTQNVSIRINPVEIAVRITTAKSFVYSDYYDENGEPIIFTDENGEEYTFKGVQFTVTNPEQESLAKEVKVKYNRNGEFTQTAPPSTVGAFMYKISAEDTNYKVIGVDLMGTITLGYDTLSSKDNSATVKAINGVLPLVIPDEEKMIELILESITYKQDSDIFANFSIPASMDKDFVMTQLTRIGLLRQEADEDTDTGFAFTAMPLVSESTQVTLKVKSYVEGQKVIRIDYDEKGNTKVVQMNATYDEATKSYIFETDKLGYFAVLDPTSEISETMLIGIVVGGVLLVLVLVTVLISIKSKNQKLRFQRELAHAGGTPAVKASKKGGADVEVASAEIDDEPIADEYDEDYEGEYDEFEN